MCIHIEATRLLWCTELVGCPVGLAMQAKPDGTATPTKWIKSGPAGNRICLNRIALGHKRPPARTRPNRHEHKVARLSPASDQIVVENVRTPTSPVCLNES